MAYPRDFKHAIELEQKALTQPSKIAGDTFERWVHGRIQHDQGLGCPEYLQQLAVENGAKLDMKVTFTYANEWQVRMETKRGTVCAAPILHERLCGTCHGAHIIPHILDGGGRPCDKCHGESVTLDQAWRNSLEELGLMSS